jgi:hypothetical protein
MNDLRDRPDLKSLLMVKLLKINRLVKSRHCYDRRMDQLGAEHFHCKQIDLQNLKFLRGSEGVSEFAIELVSNLPPIDDLCQILIKKNAAKRSQGRAHRLSCLIM